MKIKHYNLRQVYNIDNFPRRSPFIIRQNRTFSRGKEIYPELFLCNLSLNKMCATQNLLKNETLQPHLKNNWPLLSEKTTEGKHKNKKR